MDIITNYSTKLFYQLYEKDELYFDVHTEIKKENFVSEDCIFGPIVILGAILEVLGDNIFYGVLYGNLSDNESKVGRLKDLIETGVGEVISRDVLDGYESAFRNILPSFRWGNFTEISVDKVLWRKCNLLGTEFNKWNQILDGSKNDKNYLHVLKEFQSGNIIVGVKGVTDRNKCLYFVESGSIGIYPRIGLCLEILFTDENLNYDKTDIEYIANLLIDPNVKIDESKLAAYFWSTILKVRPEIRLRLDEGVPQLITYLKSKYPKFQEDFFSRHEISIEVLSAELFGLLEIKYVLQKGNVSGKEKNLGELYCKGPDWTERGKITSRYNSFMDFTSKQKGTGVAVITGKHTVGINTFLAFLIYESDPDGRHTIYIQCAKNALSIPQTLADIINTIGDSMGLSVYNHSSPYRYSYSDVINASKFVQARYVFDGISNAIPEVIDFILAFCETVSEQSRVLISSQKSIAQISKLTEGNSEFLTDFDATLDNYVLNEIVEMPLFIAKNARHRDAIKQSIRKTDVSVLRDLGDTYFIALAFFADYNDLDAEKIQNLLFQCGEKKSIRPLLEKMWYFFSRSKSLEGANDLLLILAISQTDLHQKTIQEILKKNRSDNSVNKTQLDNLTKIFKKNKQIITVSSGKIKLNRDFAEVYEDFRREKDRDKYEACLKRIITVFEDKVSREIQNNPSKMKNWLRYYRYVCLLKLKYYDCLSDSTRFNRQLREDFESHYVQYLRSEHLIPYPLRLKMYYSFYKIAKNIRDTSTLLYFEIATELSRCYERAHRLVDLKTVTDDVLRYYENNNYGQKIPDRFDTGTPSIVWVSDLIKIQIDVTGRMVSSNAARKLCENYISQMVKLQKNSLVSHALARIVARLAHCKFIEGDMTGAEIDYEKVKKLHIPLRFQRSYRNKFVIAGVTARRLLRFYVCKSCLANSDNERQPSINEAKSLLEIIRLEYGEQNNIPFLIGNAMISYFVDKNKEYSHKLLFIMGKALDDTTNQLLKLDHYLLCSIINTFDCIDRINGLPTIKGKNSKWHLVKAQTALMRFGKICDLYGYRGYETEIEVLKIDPSEIPKYLSDRENNGKYIPTFGRILLNRYRKMKNKNLIPEIID